MLEKQISNQTGNSDSVHINHRLTGEAISMSSDQNSKDPKQLMIPQRMSNRYFGILIFQEAKCI